MPSNQSWHCYYLVNESKLRSIKVKCDLCRSYKKCDCVEVVYTKKGLYFDYLSEFGT